MAYWVTPNTVLTLSGARAYCDGVFYHDDKKLLSGWIEEIRYSIKVLQSITDIYFAKAKVNNSISKENYGTYDLIITQGLEFVLNNTKLLEGREAEIINQKLTGNQLVNAMRVKLKQDERFKHFSKDNLSHIAFGILVGYPDKAILGSVDEWQKDDPFGEPLVDADIRGSWYYICPQPVYTYPRHLVNDPDIQANEQLWSTILKDFYMSDFHKNLANNTDFHQKAKELKMLR
ncbi:hypothetical protein KC946_03400 [Candidatus Saccharibacteria bacterium]|nr:hypothetical protein [Candidatus Saccharibacteria bacterium]